MKVSSTYIRIFGAVIALALVLLPVGNGAFAATPSGFPSAVQCDIANLFCSISVGLQFMILGALYGVAAFFGMLLSGFAVLIEWGINYSGTIMTLPTVVAGFDVSLSFVNLLFIFAIIFIAFKLILGLDEHGSKKMIGNLILAALLVNFSKLIAGVLIDFSNILTNFFLARFDPSSIAGAFEPQKFVDFSGAVIGNGGGYWGDFFTLFPMMLFSTLMTAFAAIILLSIFIMVMYRTIFMAFLLIVMPLIWGCWVIPSFQQYWSEWWDNFMKWIMYLPSVTFFVWLAVSTASLLGTRGGISAGSATGGLGWFESKLGAFVQMLLLGGLLIAGLKAGERSGVMGAKLGATMAGGAGKWAGGRALKFGKAVGSAGARGGAGAGAGATSLGARGLGGLANLVGAKTLGAKLKGVADATGKFAAGQNQFAGSQLGKVTAETIGLKAGAGMIKDVKDFYNVNKQQQTAAAEYQKEKASAYSDDELAARASEGKGSDTEKFGDLMELKKRGMIDAIPEGKLEKYAEAVKNIGAQNTDTAKALIAADPRLIKTMDRFATKLDENGKPVKLSAEESIDMHISNMSAGDAKKIRAPAIEKLAVKFSEKQASAIISQGSPAQASALKKTLEGIAGGNPVFGKYEKLMSASNIEKEYTDKKVSGSYADYYEKRSKELEKELSDELKTGVADANARHAKEVLDYIKQSVKSHGEEH